jgi:hypothetical protein
MNRQGADYQDRGQPEGFADFWEAYPRQRRGSKDKAKVAYAKWAEVYAMHIAQLCVVPWEEIQGRSREAHIVSARWRIIAMLREGGCSIGTIARALSKDGATVRNALRRMGMMAPKNPLYTRQKAFYTPRP